jgi:hypothetical protein
LPLIDTLAGPASSASWAPGLPSRRSGSVVTWTDGEPVRMVNDTEVGLLAYVGVPKEDLRAMCGSPGGQVRHGVCRASGSVPASWCRRSGAAGRRNLVGGEGM